MSPLVILAVTFALAFLTESLTEYLFGIPFDRLPKLKPYRWLLQYLAAGVGVSLSLYYVLDLIALIAQLAGGVLPVTPVGMVLTGLIIGRGANYLNDFLVTYLRPKFRFVDLGEE